jgi:hypothetical protein
MGAPWDLSLTIIYNALQQYIITIFLAIIIQMQGKLKAMQAPAGTAGRRQHTFFYHEKIVKSPEDIYKQKSGCEKGIEIFIGIGEECASQSNSPAHGLTGDRQNEKSNNHYLYSYHWLRFIQGH